MKEAKYYHEQLFRSHQMLLMDTVILYDTIQLYYITLYFMI